MLCPKCGSRLRSTFAVRGMIDEGGMTCWCCGFWSDFDNRGVVMADKKIDQSRLCKFPGCQKYISKKGLCLKHYNEAQVALEVAVEPAIEPVVAVLPANLGKVENVVGDLVPFGVDPVILLALRDSYNELERGWLQELSGLKPAVAICYAARMVEAVKGLGY